MPRSTSVRCHAPRPATLRRAARLLASLAFLMLTATAAPAAKSQAAESQAAGDEPPIESIDQTLTLRGRVVWMADALSRLHNVRTVPEARERILALETPTGELHPIVEDIRGRAFRRDPRLRNLEVEVQARRHRGAPMIQVIRLYELRPDGRYEIDYWCEICAIAMFELKACDCCQGPIELRKRKR